MAREQVSFNDNDNIQLIAEEPDEIHEDYQKNKVKYFFVLFVLGLLNNTGSVLVNSSAQEIAKSFNKENLMALFQFCLILFGTTIKFLNSRFLLKIKHTKRIFLALSMSLSAYIILAISTRSQESWGFYTALLGALLMGGANSLGEITNLGFMKGFAPDILLGWSSGTGFAGVFGAGVNLLLRYFHFDDFFIFLVMTPTFFIYWFGFNWMKNRRVKRAEAESYMQLENVAEVTEAGEAKMNLTLSWNNFLLIFPKIWWFSFNIGAVYFLEYICTTGFADKATTVVATEAPFIDANSFIVIQLCYQIGVVISRSSLGLIKIKKIWIMTLLQFFNCIGWGILAYCQCVNLWLLFVFMIWVGLMGGASYCNVLYQVLASEKISKNEKEIGINFISILNDAGVISSSLIVILLDNTLYQNK